MGVLVTGFFLLSSKWGVFAAEYFGYKKNIMTDHIKINLK